MKAHLGHPVGNTTPSTELPRDFCAGIDPLQLGVVLVISYFNSNDLLTTTSFLRFKPTFSITINSFYQKCPAIFKPLFTFT